MSSASTGSPMTTLSVFTFPHGSRAWAFTQMGMARPLLVNVPGLRFSRLMGAGRGRGFTLKPDWARYAFLGVWESGDDARRFLDGSPFMARYRGRAAKVATVLLRTLAARGAWGGANPFLPTSGGDARDVPGPLGVLTRATIRPLRLGSFWSQVPSVSQRLDGTPGLITSIGIGEAPFVQQATFSLWRDFEAMRAFAYQSAEHRKAITRTRRENWYAEDLFARFSVVEQVGEFP